jgi:hypothetical protein
MAFTRMRATHGYRGCGLLIGGSQWQVSYTQVFYIVRVSKAKLLGPRFDSRQAFHFGYSPAEFSVVLAQTFPLLC